jgi:hypothetical protein
MSTELGERGGAAGEYTPGLAMRVVEYPDGADRCTIYPPALDDHDRMTHWLSADRDAFVPLEGQR